MWTYDIASDKSEMKIYEDNPVNTQLVATVTNDGSGFTLPNDVTDVMESEVVPELPEQASAGNAGNPQGLSRRGAFIMLDMMQNNIEPGVPEGL